MTEAARKNPTSKLWNPVKTSGSSIAVIEPPKEAEEKTEHAVAFGFGRALSETSSIPSADDMAEADWG